MAKANRGQNQLEKQAKGREGSNRADTVLTGKENVSKNPIYGYIHKRVAWGP